VCTSMRIHAEPTTFSQIMKNRSTPRKSNLKEDPGRLELFLSSPEAAEIEVRQRVFGKNTIQIAGIFAKEFVKRFGEKWGNASEVAKALLPAGRASTYSNLHYNINMFCKQFYPTWQTDTDKVEFFDNMRFILDSLPMRMDYKPSEKKASYHTPKEIAEHFIQCHLCWRSVARKPFEKRTPLCHKHDLQSTSSEYRKLARMKTQVDNIKSQLKMTLPTLGYIKSKINHRLDVYLMNMCRSDDSPLQYLVTYLRTLNMPLTYGEDIMRALEHPLRLNKIDSMTALAWQFHFEVRGAYFERNYDKLLSAEAWLRVAAGYKHGGKRK